MKIKDIAANLGLKEQHYFVQQIDAPVVDAGVYNIFGRQLFDLYQKYKISSEDQRQMEGLAFIMTTFVINQTNKSKKSWVSYLRFWRS